MPASPSRPAHGTAWHTHPFGQTIHVTEGVRRCQPRRGPFEVIRPGDRFYFDPAKTTGTAAPDRVITYLAMKEVDDSGSLVTWAEHKAAPRGISDSPATRRWVRYRPEALARNRR